MGRQTDVHRNLYDDIEFADFDPPEEIRIDGETAKEIFPIHREPQIDTMDEPVIFSCAYPGWQGDSDHYPAVPDNPEETSQELIDSVEAGAAAVHVHPRDENGIARLSQHADLLADTLDPVFEACGEVVTFSHGWQAGAPGNIHMDYVTDAKEFLEKGDGNKYIQAALIIPPGYGSGSGVHSMDSIREGVRFYLENDIKPLFQLYDTHVVYELKRHLWEEGELDDADGPHLMAVNAGKHHSHAVHEDPWSRQLVTASMKTVEETIDDACLGVYPGGRNWLPILVHGLLMGATFFRVGIEETYWMYPHKDEVIQKNSDVIEKAVTIAEALGREVITDPDEARDYLGIEYTSPR